MKRHRFNTEEMLQMMRKVDPHPDTPVGHVFLLALAHLFRGRGIAFKMVVSELHPDIKLTSPARWWRDKATKDLIVEQGIDIKV